MTWVKIDDLFPDHPKTRRAGPEAAWLYVAGLCYCGRYLTDGLIADVSLRNLGGFSLKKAQCLAQTLCDVGLWERASAPQNGYRIHDYLDFQPAREQIQLQREAKRQAGQAGGLARARLLLEAEGKHSGVPPSHPVPSRPTPVRAAVPAAAASTLAVLTNLYENEIGTLTPIVADKLRDWADRIPENRIALIQYAFQQAASNSRRSWSYVQAILKRLEADGWPVEPEKLITETPGTLAPDKEEDWLHRRYEKSGKGSLR